MKSKKEEYEVILIMLILLFINGCNFDPAYPKIIFGEKEIIVKGPNEIRDTLTISPGTTVRIEDIEGRIDVFPLYNVGKLTILEGGKLIARGTKENPIVFIKRSFGVDPGLYFESSASNESILEYCEFREGVVVSISNSMTVQYCKFNLTSLDNLETHKNSTCLIRYNTFYGNQTNSIGIGVRDNSIPSITYNQIDGKNLLTTGIGIDPSANPKIENNNIIDCEYAVYANTQNFIITSNYIVKNGIVDITGNNSHYVTYVNPRTSPVPEAGCGW